MFGLTFNQSINQSITYIVPISLLKPGSVTRQPNWCSTAKLMKLFVISTSHWVCRYLWGKGQVKEMFLQMFLKDSNWNGWMDRWQEVVPKRRGTRVKSSCACVGLDPRDWQTNSFVWSQWTRWEWCGEHRVKIIRLFFVMKGFVGQQTDLEQYSKFYWQPMKGVIWQNTASKWRWLCHEVGRSILNTLYKSELQ